MIHGRKITRQKEIYDVGIGGKGATGQADEYNLANHTNIGSCISFEKAGDVATVNSSPENNAQTSHDGATETNYNLAHALKVQEPAKYLRNFLDSNGPDPSLYRKIVRMVLGVGQTEVELLERRFEDFKPHYPDIAMAGREWLTQNEPMVMKGRNQSEPICAIRSDEGYMVNYQEYTRRLFQGSMRARPDFDYAFNTTIEEITWKGDHYEVKTNIGVFRCKTFIFAAGPYSLFFARRLGYGLNKGIYPVGGSFLYTVRKLLNNKVYCVQIEGMPFARVHGDPDILNPDVTRFGPTTKLLPLMERHHWETFFDFMQLPTFSTQEGIAAFLAIMNNNKLWQYAFKNMVYDLPVIGPAAFMKEVRHIVPTIQLSDLRLHRHAGGIRPQIVNLETKKLEMGDSTIEGQNIIFNTTPSPGASVSMANGRRDAKKIVEMLNAMGGNFHFDEEKFQRELGKPRNYTAA
ncbi:MAG: hypothetical protein A3J46_04950 [Candidatus Yanofskybacteria bacterium RIFCSPHIGHO2_02_FULL_41_11]|uniref:malate dehydrogenase (quinone) n=1 Tax=Candidatus Yanofskybacteria bacterium RIFCSPHIGHO2_02_FULL_41_11 TaxID=1802675 RepID=A0A1F8FDV1_9BACT|nr:MAG: hypothetical protein A3J46_04950 [Candidatus Yanofskybacteria bacterium RIFCSPHIGHO2_02_FULL_41_11]